MNRTLIPVLASLLFFGCAAAEDPENADALIPGKADESGFTPCQLDAVVTYVNDTSRSAETFKTDGVHSRAADRLAERRSQMLFVDIYDIDSVPWVGPVALEQLVEASADLCDGEPVASNADVIFSPQEFPQSHLKRAIDIIDAAELSIDVAIYSFSDRRVLSALEAASARGVRIRLISNNAASDRRDPQGSISAALEDADIDVRYINKIMHHKYMIVDGPRDSLAQSTTGTLMSGSGNWSNSAGSRYDENSLVLVGNQSLLAQFQEEFNLLWDNSRDMVWQSFAHEFSTPIDTTSVPADPNAEVFFTSANFRLTDSARYGRGFGLEQGANEVSDALVELIEGATSSIKIASGHFRLRPVAEAIIAAHQNNPNLEIQIYLDGQEFISAASHQFQLDKRADCIVAAGTSASRIQSCNDKGFLYGYELAEAGIDIRFKYYSYRWHYSYAPQMHHKYLIIDDTILATGSYNLSDNAEHNTMENIVFLRADGFPDIVQSYIDNFNSMRETAVGTSLYEDLMDDVTTGDDEFRIVFDAMSLSWAEVDALKSAMKTACSEINSADFRSRPERHFSCDPTN